MSQGSKFSAVIDSIEETFIALCLGLMTLITFANVIARSLDSNILWAVQATVYLFAWMVLIGTSYCVKKNLHIGVDSLVNIMPIGIRKIVALVAVSCCLLFSVLLLVGCYQYWHIFATKSSFLEVDDIPMPEFLQFLSDWTNYGERYEKIPRYIPYFALPLGALLLVCRFLQAGYRILMNRQMLLIISHEVDKSDDQHLSGDEGRL